MRLTIQSRSFWPGAAWIPESADKPVSLPLGGGEVRVTTESGRPALVRRAGLDGSGTAQTPCSLVFCSSQQFDSNYEVVDNDGDTQRFLVRVGADEGFAPEVLRDLADFRERLESWCSRTDKSAEALFEALRSGRLTLLTRTDPLSGLSTDYAFEEILKGCPSLLEICERPRLHLHVEESVRPIGVVRRSGPAAIKHLARHSEHWEARTVSGLRPARLLAQVLEDDWHLYENRFVVTLVRKLQRYLQLAWKEINSRLEQATGSIDLFAISSNTRVHQPRALSYLLPNVRKEDIDDSWLLLDDLHSQLKKLLRVTAICRQSRLCQRLHKCDDVRPPILNTNILTMDRRYRRARELWDLIRLPEADPQNGTDGAVSDDLASVFVDFCQVLILAGLNVSGFSPIQPDVPLADRSTSAFELQGAYRRHNWIITPRLKHSGPMMPWLSIRWTRGVATEFPFTFNGWQPQLRKVLDRYEVTSNGIVFYDRLSNAELQEIKGLPLASNISKHRQSWKSFVEDSNRRAAPAYSGAIGLLPIFSKVLPSSRRLDAITSDLLDRLIEFGSKNGLKSTYALVPVAFSESDEASVAADRVVRRLLNFGDRFAPGEAGPWGGYRAGIIPVSRDQFGSLSRIAQLVNYQTVRFSLDQDFSIDGCPLCGLNTFGQDDGVYSCHSDNCGAVWIYAACAHCRNRYPMIKRRDPVPGRARQPDGTFLEFMLASEEVSDPRTGAAPQPFFCTNGVLQEQAVICPHCGLCSESARCSRSCIYRSPISLDITAAAAAVS